MKNIIKIITLVAVLLTVENASAQSRRKTYGGSTGYGTTSSTPVETSYSNESSYGGGSQWAVGFASAYNVVRTNLPTITGMYSWNEKMGVQAYFISYKDSTSEGNGFGGIFKYTFAGNQMAGVHGGGGLSFGKYTTSFSFTHILANFGFHFTIHRQVVMHVDGGLTILNDDTTGGNKDSGTYIAGGSNFMGISMMYMF